MNKDLLDGITDIEVLKNSCRQLNKLVMIKENKLDQQQQEIERLNNIINELEHDFESYELEYLQETYQGSLVDFIETELERIQELKGSEKE